MKLCISTYTSVLAKGKARTTTQVDLISALFDCIPNFYDYNTLIDGQISDIIYGKKNAPDKAIEMAKQCNPRAVADSIKADFLKLLDNNKKGSIILALKDIVSKDQNLADDTKIEMVNGMTKAAFLNRDSFVYADLLAGLFLYILIYTDNQGMRGEAKAITEEYLDSFRSKADDLSYLESYSDADRFISVNLSEDAHTAVLLAEAEGKCINCGRPIAINDNGISVNRAKVLTLPGKTDVILCADCERIVSSYDEGKLAALAKKQADAGVLNSVRDEMVCERLDGEIETVLRHVHNLEESDETRLKLEPVVIDKKITDIRLRERVRGDVVTLFDGVNTILERLDGEKAFNSRKFARQMKRAFEDTKDSGLSQRQIYDLLVDKLNVKSGGQYKTACEVIISYFVQRCEVFDEITE